MPVFLLILLGVVVSRYLIVTGWRGRRVGSMPCCTACGFDLTGLLPDTDPGSDGTRSPCPECGADLTLPDATVIGERRRRPGLMGLGLAVLAMCATFTWFGVQGRLNSSSVISAMPSGWMIGYAVRDTERPYAEDMRWELGYRMASGKLTDPETLRHTGEALLAAAVDPQHALPEGLVFLLDEIAVHPNTPAETRRAIVDMLFARAVRADSAWSLRWMETLIALRGNGVVSDEDWGELLKAICTPRLWRLGEDPLSPGEGFLVGLEFLGDRVWSGRGRCVFVFELPEGVEHEVNIGENTWSQWNGYVGGSATGLPGRHTSLRGWLRAPETPGHYEIGVRVAYTEEDDGKPDPYDRLRAGTYPGAVELRDILTIDVAEHQETEPAGGTLADSASLAEWMRGRVLPIDEQAIELAIPRGRFVAKGSLIAVDVDGRRETQSTFAVKIERGRHSAQWSVPSGASGGGNGTGGNSYEQASIPVRVKTSDHPFGSPRRFVLVFEILELPDGRIHNGPEPLEVPVPAHPLGPSSAW